MKVIRGLFFLLVLAGLLLVQPDDSIAQSFVQRANELRAALDYHRAADYVRVALVRQPWNATLYLKSAETLLLDHDEPAAQQALTEAQRLGADMADVEQLRALLAQQGQRFDEAIQHWQQFIERRPFDGTAYAQAIDLAMRGEQWATARTLAEQWVARTSLPQAHFILAKIIALDDPTTAQGHFRQAPSDQAQSFLAALAQTDRVLQLMLLGRAYLAGSDLALAQRAFDEAIALNSEYAEAQAYAGFVRDQRGADGRAWLDRAVKLDPNLIVARYFLARHLWDRGDLDGALDELKYANEHDPANALIAAEIGRMYMQRSDYPNAEQWLTKARDLAPNDVTILNLLAELYVGRSYGASDQGVSVAQRIVSLAPEEAGSHVWLGRAYLLSGDRGGAERELREAVRLNPQSALAHFYLGRLFGQNTEASRAEYARAVTLDPDGPIGAAAQRALEMP